MFAQTLTTIYTNFGGNLISVMPLYSTLMMFLAEGDDIGTGLKMLGAGLTGTGMIGASIGQGIVGYGACVAIGRNPETAPKITSTLIVTAGFCESGAIYALVIAILLIFVA
ncbi:F0F1 ATP synthase subunit C [Spiroplasma diminutum CUAS-1]|uniref:ATP synthase subunit c n=2 Tax=Spiroplasma diminutum TaxID=216936 RepID=S5MIL8_9MOLU|nr:F0F1 ATP synthase subunit C [Spiroplasma diminutum]AGR41755.1 F0F1 ATP synthase subunit C [Spiroplasma diminutum CUAS-1]